MAAFETTVMCSNKFKYIYIIYIYIIYNIKYIYIRAHFTRGHRYGEGVDCIIIKVIEYFVVYYLRLDVSPQFFFFN